MKYKFFRLIFVLTFVFGLAMVSAPQTARAAGPWYVSITGNDANDCMSPATPCATINSAIGKASAGDTVNVAIGIYTGTNNEVVLIDKDVTLSGGWDATFVSQNGFSAIDSQNSRRGVMVSNGVIASIERFIIKNGFLINYGAGVYNSGTLTINNSSIHSNSIGNASYGGGVFNDSSGVLTLNNTTVSNNSASSNGGGIFNIGSITLSNSTVSNNSVIIFDPAGHAGGIANSGTAQLNNTIIADNARGDCGGNSITSLGNNIIGSTSDCNITPSNNDQFNVNPLLGTFLSTQGYSPVLPGSPAINAGNPATCLSTDQRGVNRPQGAVCDIGAYEYTTPGTATNAVMVAGNPQRTPPNSTYIIPFKVLMLDSQGTPVNGVTATFSAPGSGASGTFSDTGINSTSVNTDMSGLATAPAFTANNLFGAFALSVSSATSGSINFNLENAGWFVSPAGNDANSCTQPDSSCATINAAFNKPTFIQGDTILIAGGSDTSPLSISKSLNLSGGWDSTFTTQTGFSTIDGQNIQRGLYVYSGVSASIYRFIIKNGFVSDYGAGIYNNGTLSISNSSIYNNSIGNYCYGGGIFNNFVGILTLNNTTVSTNSASCDGGGIFNTGMATLNNSTISNNSAPGSGGGIYNSGTTVLLNTIVSGNIGGDCSGSPFTSLGNNIVGTTTSCDIIASSSDQFNVDPILGTFVSVQGYYPLLTGSPAIDAGNPSTCLANDQRGLARPYGAACDIGAYEYTPPGVAINISIVAGNSQRTPPTTIYPTLFQVLVVDGQGSPVGGVTVTFTAPANGASGTFADTGTNITSINTDTSGVATAPAFTANNQAGAYALSASVTEVGSANFNLKQIFPPANDNFASAEVITSMPFTATTDITDTTAEANEPQYCYGMPNTVWYSFTPTETMSVLADTQGSVINGNVNIYRAGSGISDLQFLGCTTPSSSTQFLAEVGQTYYLQAGAASYGEVGTIQVNLQQVFPPANDNFANAESITSLPFSATVDITHATNELNELQNCSSMPNTVWYSFTPTETMLVRADTQGSAITGNVNGYSTSNLNFIGCSVYFNIPITFLAEAGQTYYFQAGAAYGEVGTIQVNLKQVVPPANDNFTNAEAITSLPFSGTANITDASNEPNEPQWCYSIPNTVWYSFTPTSNALVKADMAGSSFSDTIFNVYQAVSPGINGLSFQQCASYGNSATFNVQAGVTYYIQAGSINNSGGDLHLNLQELIPPENADFANAIAITSLPFSATPDITNGGTESNEPQSCYYMPDTVWYSFTPTENTLVRTNTDGSAINSNINVYKSNGPGISNLTNLGCTIYNGPITFLAEAGQTYYLQAGGLYGQTGTMSVNLEQLPLPANDDFAKATSITVLPSTIDFDTTWATFQSGETSPSCAYPAPPYKTLWFAYTATQTGSISASIPSWSFSPFIAAYSGTGFSNLTQLGCNQYSNKMTFHVVSGQTYYFQVGGFYGGGGAGQFLLETTPAPQASFYYYPGDPSKYDTVQFLDSSYDPGQAGFQTYTWNFGDGSSSTNASPTHKYAADGNYQVTHTVTTADGRTGTVTQTVQVHTHDVAITKLSTPNSANVGQTKTITVTLRNVAYPETVQIDLYKSTANGFVLVGTVTKSVPALSGNRTTAVDFSYKFISDDAKLGKVTFRAVATIVGARDTYPSDNEAISLITKVAK